MNNPQLMVAFTIQMIDGSTASGAVAVPGADPVAACNAVAGAIRSRNTKYTRHPALAGIDPAQVEDVSVQCIGVA
ncbi:hypothetical protein GPEL0_01f1425 [Geoanaerobacter pelophilus]|uniref:DUF1659 domain-containing protein n=1 Tax=Geoanaerobacter pelophilus TaxID=60036 RepID=A0ABQ0MGK4_9BACT|nr:hypothetical protein [Geoanaerobacter pelophilus]GAW66174.1 hypothetical protein GPEL0_01f1425 [Geoanaerobacter pelophilus]